MNTRTIAINTACLLFAALLIVVSIYSLQWFAFLAWVTLGILGFYIRFGGHRMRRWGLAHTGALTVCIIFGLFAFIIAMSTTNQRQPAAVER